MKLIIIPVLLMLMSGCSYKYPCSDFPDAGCQPVKAVYEDTNDGLYDYRREFYQKRKKAEAEEKGDIDSVINIAPSEKALALPNPGDPILSKPVVLRVLVASWEDKDGDLNAGGYLFLKVRDSQWKK